MPLSITAIDSAVLQRNRIESVQDITRLEPSLVFERNFSLQDTRPVIRGLPDSRGRPAVGVLVDGVDTSSESMGASAGGSQLFNTRLVDVERVEVVKGPQSALYGRVAFGGAINYISKQPSHTPGAEVSLSEGQYGDAEYRGAVTGPINDEAAYRINGYYAQSDGYYRNQVSGRYVGGYTSAGGVLAVAYDPLERLHILGQFSFSEDKDAPAAQEYIGFLNGTNVNNPAVPSFLTGPPYVPGSPTTYPGPAFGTLSAPPQGVRLSVDPRTGRDFPGAVLKTARGTLHVDLDLGFARFTSISSLTHAQFSELDDDDFYGVPSAAVTAPPPGGAYEPLQRFGVININGGNVKQFNQELRLARLDGTPLRWAVGGLYWYEDYRQNQASFTSVVSAPASAALNTAYDLATVPNFPGERTTNSASFYGLVEYDFLQKFTASAEGRYFSERYGYVFSAFPGTVGTGLLAPAPVVALANPIPAATSNDFFTPKVLLRYRASEDLMAYVSAGEGEKPGGYNTVSIVSSTGNKFGPEKLWNYELGLKARFFDRKLVFDGALFYMNYTGKQENVTITSNLTVTGFASAIQNVGGARVKGVEANVTFLPTRDLSMTLGYTFLDARYTDYRVDVNNALFGSLINSCVPNTHIGTGVFCEGNLAGNRLERTPENSVVLTGRYSQPLVDDLSAFVEADARYTGNREVFEYNRYLVPAQTIANLRLGVSTPRWTALAYIDNLFNEDKIQSAFGAGDMQKPGQLAIIVNPADPRRAGVRLSYKW